MRFRFLFPAFALSLLPLGAAPLLSPGDIILPIHTDTASGTSASPAGEGPSMLFDNDSDTKYLNLGGSGSGFIATLSAQVVVRSFIITTANDARNRDPSSYQIWGTNSPVLSTNHSNGDAETWTLISSGSLSLPNNRRRDDGAVSFLNSASFTSYKVVFPNLRGGASEPHMQISGFQAYTQFNGGGTGIFGPATPVLAIDTPVQKSSSPSSEGVANLIDRGTAKYLNFGGAGSGFIVTPQAGSTIIREFTVTTGLDSDSYPGRSPASFVLYGTNDPVTSRNHSAGDRENWTVISSGPLDVPPARYTVMDPVTLENNTAYLSYKMVFPALAGADSLQLGEVQFYGSDGMVYTSWQEQYFTGEELADGSISGPEADPDGDGVTNLELFLHGLPRGPQTVNPVIVTDTAFDGTHRPRFTFPVRHDLSGIIYVMEKSTSMDGDDSWESVPFKEVGRENGEGFDTVAIEPNEGIPSGPAFFRLRFTEQ